MKKSRNKKACHPFDVYIGSQVQVYRVMRDLSQGQLAEMVGITFQQIQKYENGTNRITVGRLLDISQALHVPITQFMDGYVEGVQKGNDLKLSDMHSSIERKEIIQLIQSYSHISNVKLRHRFQKILKIMAG